MAGHLELNGTEIRDLVIPNSVTTLRGYTFVNCKALNSITLPNSVTAVEPNSFYLCTEVTRIIVLEGNSIYDSRNNCNAVIESATNTIVFGCQSTTIPNSVMSIGDGAFNNCIELKSIEIPNSVTSIGKFAFAGCLGLTSIELPNSVTTMSDFVFAGSYNLSHVGLPKFLKSIPKWCFFHCDKLKSISIPKSVSNIEAHAFEATGFTNIEIPNSIMEIGSSAFENCRNLERVKIPASVTSIGNVAFYHCLELENIELYWSNPAECVLGNDILMEIPASCTISIPYGTLAAYQASEVWGKFNLVEREPTEIKVTLGAEYGTFCSEYALDFSEVKGLTAYAVTAFDSEGVTIMKVGDVPAYTGVLLHADEARTYTVPVGEGKTYVANLLRGTTEDISLPATDGAYTNFILAKGTEGTIGFYPVSAGGGTLAAGKAWLPIPTSFVSTFSASRGLALNLEGETTTGAEKLTMNNEQLRIDGSSAYDLQGRRVGDTERAGVYIMKGKKVINK